MRRSAGAILRDTRPATIIRSDWRGLPRNTSAPKRAMSYREQLIAIISIAQQARPKVTGQMDERRAHCTIFSTVVVSTGISDSSPMARPPSRNPPVFDVDAAWPCRARGRRPDVAAPVEGAFAPDIHVAGQQQEHEQ